MKGFQRRYLRSLAHALEPVVLIGRNGVTEALLSKTDAELDAHELIKLRFGDWKQQKAELLARIAQATQSELAGVLGNTAILYREHADPACRKIRLPVREPWSTSGA